MSVCRGLFYFGVVSEQNVVSKQNSVFFSPNVLFPKQNIWGKEHCVSVCRSFLFRRGEGKNVVSEQNSV